MLVSKIGSSFCVNNFRYNPSFQRREVLSPLKADTFTFSGKVQDKKGEPQLKEKTIYIFLGAPASGKVPKQKSLRKN